MLIEELTAGEMALGTMVFFLVGRFLFSAVSFGSGAPGGIFFPMLIIGAFIGGIFAEAGHVFFGLEEIYLNNFVLLAMAGYFTAIVRAPLTGIILIFEMTGSVNQMLSLALVSIMAYIVATLMRSEPIYESLLRNLLKREEKKYLRGEEKSTDRMYGYAWLLCGRKENPGSGMAGAVPACVRAKGRRRNYPKGKHKNTNRGLPCLFDR